MQTSQHLDTDLVRWLTALVMLAIAGIIIHTVVRVIAAACGCAD